MLHTKVISIPKVWYRFTRAAKNGNLIKFRWEQLSDQRYGEFIDFMMNHYVKHEIFHVATGIHKNAEAMEEYRKIVSKKFTHPSHHTAICCIDDEAGDIVAFDSLHLCSNASDEDDEDFKEAKTTELKTLYEIESDWKNILSVSEVVKKYGVEKFMSDGGCAIHTNYRGYRISPEISVLRRMVSKHSNVALTGGWVTAIGTQKSADRDGWETIYEIGYKQMENKFGIKFQNPPPTFQYKVKRID